MRYVFWRDIGEIFIVVKLAFYIGEIKNVGEKKFGDLGEKKCLRFLAKTK